MLFWSIISTQKCKKCNNGPILDINMVCLWDSNTAPTGIVSITNKYVYLLWQETNITSFNKWISSEKTTDIYARLSSDLYPLKNNEKRNIATLLVWTNDVSAGKTSTQTWADMQDLITAIISNWWELLLMTYPPRWETNYTTTIKEINTLIRNNQSLWYTCVDVYQNFVDGSDNMINSLYTTDLVHFLNQWNIYIKNDILTTLT